MPTAIGDTESLSPTVVPFRPVDGYRLIKDTKCVLWWQVDRVNVCKSVQPLWRPPMPAPVAASRSTGQTGFGPITLPLNLFA